MGADCIRLLLKCAMHPLQRSFAECQRTMLRICMRINNDGGWICIDGFYG